MKKWGGGGERGLHMGDGRKLCTPGIIIKPYDKQRVASDAMHAGSGSLIAIRQSSWHSRSS